MQFDFKMLGVQQILARFSRFADKVQDYRPAWKPITKDFYEIQKAQFDSEGARGPGGKWKRLSTKYAKWKAKNYPGRPLLVLKGNLRKSLTQAGGRGLALPLKTKLTLGVRKGKLQKIAGYHMHGTSKMAKRMPIDLKPADKSRWMKRIHEFVFFTAKKLGLTYRRK